MSNFFDIGLSIVQGSGIGPTLYTIMTCDLHALSEINDIFKYADTLLVLQHTDIELDIEFNHVKSWAATNQLTIKLK